MHERRSCWGAVLLSSLLVGVAHGAPEVTPPTTGAPACHEFEIEHPLWDAAEDLLATGVEVEDIEDPAALSDQEILDQAWARTVAGERYDNRKLIHRLTKRENSPLRAEAQLSLGLFQLMGNFDEYKGYRALQRAAEWGEGPVLAMALVATTQYEIYSIGVVGCSTSLIAAIDAVERELPDRPALRETLLHQLAWHGEDTKAVRRALRERGRDDLLCTLDASALRLAMLRDQGGVAELEAHLTAHPFDPHAPRYAAALVHAQARYRCCEGVVEDLAALWERYGDCGPWQRKVQGMPEGFGAHTTELYMQSEAVVLALMDAAKRSDPGALEHARAGLAVHRAQGWFGLTLEQRWAEALAVGGELEEAYLGYVALAQDASAYPRQRTPMAKAALELARTLHDRAPDEASRARLQQAEALLASLAPTSPEPKQPVEPAD